MKNDDIEKLVSVPMYARPFYQSIVHFHRSMNVDFTPMLPWTNVSCWWEFETQFLCSKASADREAITDD